MQNMKIFDLETDRQFNRIQHSHCCHSMTNSQIFKSPMMHFRASSHHFQDIKFQIFYLDNLGQGTMLAMMPFNGEYECL